MIVDFKPGDGQLLAGGLTLYVKACEAAVKGCEKIGLMPAPFAVQDALGHALSAQEDVKGWLGEYGDCPRTADLSLEVRDAMHRGVWLALEKLSKLEDGQTELGIVPEDTRNQQDHGRNLADRLHGQSSLGDDVTVTFSGGGHDPVTVTGTELERAAARKHALRNA